MRLRVAQAGGLGVLPRCEFTSQLCAADERNYLVLRNAKIMRMNEWVSLICMELMLRLNGLHGLALAAEPGDNKMGNNIRT